MEMINKLAPLSQRPPRNYRNIPETPNSNRELMDFEDKSRDVMKVPRIFMDITYKRSREGQADVCFKRMKISN